MSTFGDAWEPGKEAGGNPRNWPSGFPVPTGAQRVESWAPESPKGASSQAFQADEAIRTLWAAGYDGGEGTYRAGCCFSGRLACSSARNCQAGPLPFCFCILQGSPAPLPLGAHGYHVWMRQRTHVSHILGRPSWMRLW